MVQRFIHADKAVSAKYAGYTSTVFGLSLITVHIEAFNTITPEPEITELLVTLKSEYNPWNKIPNTSIPDCFQLYA